MRVPCVLVFLLSLLLASCSRDPALPGKYVASRSQEAGAAVVLVLKADGRGNLSFGTEEAPVRWSSSGRSGEVLLHTRDGGVVRAKLSPQGQLEMDLPGSGRLVFWKIEVE